MAADRASTTSWRETERSLLDALRHQGIRVVDICGEPIVVVELFDEATGQSLGVQRIFSIEKLARSLEQIK
jgi:hypothetical protein